MFHVEIFTKYGNDHWDVAAINAVMDTVQSHPFVTVQAVDEWEEIKELPMMDTSRHWFFNTTTWWRSDGVNIAVHVYDSYCDAAMFE